MNEMIHCTVRNRVWTTIIRSARLWKSLKNSPYHTAYKIIHICLINLIACCIAYFFCIFIKDIYYKSCCYIYIRSWLNPFNLFMPGFWSFSWHVIFNDIKAFASLTSNHSSIFLVILFSIPNSVRNQFSSLYHNRYKRELLIFPIKVVKFQF